MYEPVCGRLKSTDDCDKVWSRTSRLPVIYVFGKKDVDTDDCSTSLKDILLCQSDIKRPVLLRHDVAYTHQAGPKCIFDPLDVVFIRFSDAIATKLRILLEPLQIPVLYSQIPTKATPVSVQSTSIDNDTIENCTIFYIGGESLSLTNLLITHSSCDVRASLSPYLETNSIISGLLLRPCLQRHTARVLSHEQAAHASLRSRTKIP